MKKTLFILAVITAMTAFSGCTKEEDKLVGTKWMTSDYGDKTIVLEFTSSSTVIGYIASENGVIDGNTYSGSYSISGNSITFNNMRIIRKTSAVWNYYDLQTGILNGSIISTVGKETYNLDSGQWYSWNMTWNKQ